MILTSKKDVDNYAICYGNNSKPGATSTPQECKTKLEQKVQKILRLVKKDFHDKELTDGQITAIVSFYYNAGRRQHIINSIKYESEATTRKHFKVYEYDKYGNHYPGLKRRREAELILLYP